MYLGACCTFTSSADQGGESGKWKIMQSALGWFGRVSMPRIVTSMFPACFQHGQHGQHDRHGIREAGVGA